MSKPGAAAAEDVDAATALERLYDAHYVRLVRLAVLLLRDHATAEDVVQEAFVAMYRRWDSLEDPDRAVAYLRASVVNGSRSTMRHLRVVDRHRPEEPPDAPGADQAALAVARRRTVLDALGRLPRRQREVLALRYYLDLSESEIADALGISNGAVKTHASRGAVALRATLSRLLEEDS